MTPKELKELLTALGHASPEGLDWLSGSGKPGGRPIYRLAFDRLRAALRGLAPKGKAASALPLDPSALFDLVVTSEGEILTLQQVKEARPRAEVSCLVICLDPLAPMGAEELEAVRTWETLTPAKRASAFTGSLAAGLALMDQKNGAKAGLTAGLGSACAAALRPQLEDSVAQIEATPVELGLHAAAETAVGQAGMIDGTGVILGLVDFGCDFVHPNFRAADGATRLLGIWDQNHDSAGAARGPGLGGFPGSLFPRAAINWALDPERTPAPEGFDQRGMAPTALDPSELPYWRLGYDPHARHYLPVEMLGGAHGTHVMDIAAGNGFAVEKGPPRGAGVAPSSDLLFVQLAKHAPTSEGAAIDSAELLMGVIYIFYEAQRRNRPAVVNLSLNGNAGPHDGRSLFDQALSWLLLKPGRAVVVAAGNFRQQETHVRRVLESGDSTRFLWLVPPGDETQNRAQFWSDCRLSDLSLTLSLHYRPAEGEGLVLPLQMARRRLDQAESEDSDRLRMGEQADLWLTVPPKAMPDAEETALSGPRCRVGAAALLADSATGRTVAAAGQNAEDDKRCLCATLLVEPELLRQVVARHLPEGAYDPETTLFLEVTLTSHPYIDTLETLVIDGWIERDDFRIDESGSALAHQSRFASPQDGLSLGALSCGAETIVVGAYHESSHEPALWDHSSLGPTRDGDAKPDVSAPGRLIRAARSKGFQLRYPDSSSAWRTSSTIAFSGTSMAAPHVAGIAALLLQVDPSLTSAEIRDLLRQSARRPEQGLWHAGFGQGRVSAAAALRLLRQRLAEKEQ
ncbi:MAG: S8 family serine peptidase [Pseudomonadota bacterium]